MAEFDAQQPCCRLAICRESFGDGNEWSIYLLNDLPVAITAIVERLDWEWGDLGHAQSPGTQLALPSHAAARICRVDADCAELSMSVSLRLAADDRTCRVTFELGRLYHYRNPVVVNVLGKAGWVREPEECRFL